MASVFTKIIRGELPARFVWKDDRCVAFLSARPLKPGHTLVVPREEIDHWLDLPPDILAHLSAVSQKIGRAIQRGFKPAKVGVMLVGLEVRHVHYHLVPIEGVRDLDFDNQDPNPDAAMMDRAAELIRSSLVPPTGPNTKRNAGSAAKSRVLRLYYKTGEVVAVGS